MNALDKSRADWFITTDGLVRKNIVGFERDLPVPGTRVCLFSTYDEKYDCLAAIAEPNWTEYCTKHGYALRTYPGAFHLDPSRPDTYGDKVKFSLYHDLRGLFDEVVFLDIDSLFVNMEKPMEQLGEHGPKMLWTFGEGGPMSGLMVMSASDRTEKHLRYAYELAARENNTRHGVIEPNGISDQDAMTRLMTVPPFIETFQYCVPAESVGFCYPDTENPNPWIVTCRGGSLEDKLARMRQWGIVARGAAAIEEAVEAFELEEARHDNHHPVEAYNPRFSFDRNWVGPPEMKPRVYRTQSEKDTWYAVAVENEYRLGELQPTDVVVDIGAHIGSFCYLAYKNGSRSVYGYEIDPWHLQAAVVNLGDCQDGAGVEQFAVVRGDEQRAATYHYDGAWNSFGQLGPVVPSRSLDEIIDAVCAPGETVRFLKIDCEGGEYPIFYTCKQMERIQEIAGEWHRMDPSAPELQGLPYATNEDGLVQFLQTCGFEVEITRPGEGNGGFWAKRPVALHRGRTATQISSAKFGTVVKLS